MWARYGEILIASWLIASPFLFRPWAGDAGWAVLDVVAGVFAAAFAVGSFWRPVAWLHFLNLGIAALLVLPSYTFDHPAPAYVQNRIIAGMLLGIFALVPPSENEEHVPDTEF